MQTSPKLVAFP